MPRLGPGHKTAFDSRVRLPHDGVDVTTTPQVVVAANPDRVGVFICNDGAAKVYLGLGLTAAIGEGIVLGPGQGMYLDISDTPVSAVAATGTVRVTWAEV